MKFHGLHGNHIWCTWASVLLVFIIFKNHVFIFKKLSYLFHEYVHMSWILVWSFGRNCIVFIKKKFFFCSLKYNIFSSKFLPYLQNSYIYAGIYFIFLWNSKLWFLKLEALVFMCQTHISVCTSEHVLKLGATL
jgi:hypothetical protein